MAKEFKDTAVIIRQEEIADGVYSMWLKSSEIARSAVPGQFIAIYSRDGSRLLPRPISICEIDREDGALHVVYQVVGRGTDQEWRSNSRWNPGRSAGHRA